ncbi:hypothetical protein GCM10022254_73640 [Actinomadura meridiana]|uniref:Uncharacterized protein n=1 Tax=Actinomadura meridiana TaxID=559626 RepID=A0ABP8CQC9_9ACTN
MPEQQILNKLQVMTSRNANPRLKQPWIEPRGRPPDPSRRVPTLPFPNRPDQIRDLLNGPGGTTVLPENTQHTPAPGALSNRDPHT